MLLVVVAAAAIVADECPTSDEGPHLCIEGYCRGITPDGALTDRLCYDQNSGDTYLKITNSELETETGICAPASSTAYCCTHSTADTILKNVPVCKVPPSGSSGECENADTDTPIVIDGISTWYKNCLTYYEAQTADETNNNLSAAAIGGIVGGSIGGVVLISVAVYFATRRKSILG
tara:strand:- start:123 stop:653 length:531 start_codon:yes stop_codon:yes gene_type:complete